jgi:hypothetical protein
MTNMDNQDQQKSFLVQPEANNSVTLWVAGQKFQAIADGRILYIAIPEGSTAVLLSNGVRFNPPPKPK